jgi:SMODS-associating 2TM, beta-strand rich effector domain
MRNVNLKVLLWILLGVSGIAWFVIGYVTHADLSKLSEFFRPLPKVITVDVIAVAVFVRWVWRWRWLRGWLVSIPNLNGTWLGEIRSDWIDERTDRKVLPIPAMLTIRQTFFHISCVMQTAEMRSDSYVEGFRIDYDCQIRELAYSYQGKPRLPLQDRSTPHDGTAVFEVIETPARKLRGRYWTERKTTGEMDFRFYSNRALEELPEGIGPHPMSEKASES